MYKLLILCFFISACAQRVKVPVNRFSTPEAVGVGLELEARQVGYSSGLFDFSNNQTDNALQMSLASNQEFYMGLGVSHNVDFFLKIPEESSSLIGVKIQFVGGPKKAISAGHQLSFTMGMGSERDKFDDEFEIDLKSDVQDYMLLHGYRFNESFLLYDGIALSHYDFEGTISGAPTLENNDLNYSAENILGFFVGVELGGPSFNFKAETAIQKIKWSNTDEKLFFSFGYALTARF